MLPSTSGTSRAGSGERWESMLCYFSAQLGAGLRSVRSPTTPASPTGDMELAAQEMRITEQTKAADLSTWKLRR